VDKMILFYFGSISLIVDPSRRNYDDVLRCGGSAITSKKLCSKIGEMQAMKFQTRPYGSSWHCLLSETHSSSVYIYKVFVKKNTS